MARAVALWQAALASAASPSVDKLSAMVFRNNGTVTSDDVFTLVPQASGYLECDNCSQAQHSWSVNNRPYLYQVTFDDSFGPADAGGVGNPEAANCSFQTPMQGFDMRGSDFGGRPAANEGACASACCALSGCVAYTFATVPYKDEGCGANVPCCFPKKGGQPSPSGLKGIVTALRAGYTPPCKYDSVQKGVDMHGTDMGAVAVANDTECHALCCANATCIGFVFALAPRAIGSCQQGQPCCFPKSATGPTSKSTIPQIELALKTGHAPPAPPGPPQPSGTQVPPTGMRSAVPLGGIAAGSIELRTDGTLHEWTIENQSPAGGTKIQLFNDALFGIQVNDWPAQAVRTHPPQGVPGVEAITYSGAHPMSRLAVRDSTLDAAGIEATLYAYSTYRPADMRVSARPAVAFSLALSNPSEKNVPVRFMFNLPVSIEVDQAREFGLSKSATIRTFAVSATAEAPPAVACLRACASQAGCAAWSVASNGTAEVCSLYNVAGLNEWRANVTSGVIGTWTRTHAKMPGAGSCFTLNRPGTGPMHGNLSLCAASDAAATTSFLAGDTLASVWQQFDSGEASVPLNGSHGYGAVVLSTNGKGLPPGGTASLTVTLSWYFPNRDYMGTDVGNFYATAWPSSEEVGLEMLGDATAVVDDIAALHAPFFGSTMPDWLQDSLVNSLSHIRSAWWTAKGEWRQWEAYDCVNVDSVHNDGERHIPYITFWPNATRDKLRAWSRTQQADGMIPEQLMCGCTGAVDPNIDVGCGRKMSDVSSMYILYLVEMLRWGGDVAIVKELWPVAAKAASWQMNVSASIGVPEHLCNTYDILGPTKFEQVSYNSVFHIAAMVGCEALANAMGDAAMQRACAAAGDRARAVLDNNQWVPGAQKGSPGHYSFNTQDNSSLMVDSLYAQVLAYSEGLGLLVSSEDKVSEHLQTEALWADTPHGLIVSTTGTQQSGQIWQGGSPNWASLNIRLGMPPDEALAQPAKSLGLWNRVINDQWSTAGLASTDGQPWITSHYGFHMVEWHLILALSGQQANLPAGELVFSFADKNLTTASYPVILPGVLGTVSRTLSSSSSSSSSSSPSPGVDSAPAAGTHNLTIVMGSLRGITTLVVDGSRYPSGAVNLEAGQSVAW